MALVRGTRTSPAPHAGGETPTDYGVTSYRRVIVTTIIIAVALATLGTLLQQAQATLVYTGVLFSEAIADVAASAYLTYLAYTDKARPRGWLLLFLVVGAWFITAAYLIIGGIVVLRTFGYVLPPGLGLTLLGESIVLVGAVPIMKGMLFWLVQHDAAVDGGIVADEALLQDALVDKDVMAALGLGDKRRAARLIMVCLQRAQS